MRYRLTCFLLLQCLWPAASSADTQPYKFMVRENGWTVWSSETVCSAVNRDLVEFNAAPYNALLLRQLAGKPEPEIIVMFWPGAFAADSDVTLDFELYEGHRFSLKARASDGYAARSVATVPPEDLNQMRRSLVANVTVSGVKEQLAFSTAQFDSLLFNLGKCAAGLPK